MAPRSLDKPARGAPPSIRSRRPGQAPTRLPVYALDRAQPVPLSAILNFGPVTAAELASLGVMTLEDLESLGAEDTLRRWTARFPNRLNVNAALGLVVTLDGGVWTTATGAQRASARRLVDRLRAELGMSPARPGAHRSRSTSRPSR